MMLGQFMAAGAFLGVAVGAGLYALLAPAYKQEAPMAISTSLDNMSVTLPADVPSDEDIVAGAGPVVFYITANKEGLTILGGKDGAVHLSPYARASFKAQHGAWVQSFQGMPDE